MMDIPRLKAAWQEYKTFEAQYSRIRNREGFPEFLDCLFCENHLHEVTDKVYLLARFADILVQWQYERSIFQIMRESGDMEVVDRLAQEKGLSINTTEMALHRLATITTSLYHHGVVSPQLLYAKVLHRFKARAVRRLACALLLLSALGVTLHWVGLIHIFFYVVLGIILIAVFVLGRTFFSSTNRLKRQEAIKHIKDGNKLLDAGSRQEALQEYRQASDIVHGDYRIHNSLGLSYREAKEFGLAIEQYHKALVLRSNDSEVYFNLANIYIRLDTDFFDSKKAEAHYLKTIALDHRHAAAHFNLALHYMDMQRYGDARRYLREAKRLGIAKDRIDESMQKLELVEMMFGRSP